MLLIVTIVLICFGLMMLLSASAPTSVSETGKSTKYLVKQGMITVLGFVAMLILSKLDYRIWKKFVVPIYVVSVVILALVGTAGIEKNGGKRWIMIAGFSLQPSEFVKVGLAIVYAQLLTTLKENGGIKTLGNGLLLPILLFVPIVVIMLKLQNHFSATLIMGAIICIEMFVAGTNFIPAIIAVLLASPLGALYILKSSAKSTSGSEDMGFRLERFYSWLDIESDVTGKGWQINQSLYAIGSGGPFGVGLGNSKQKYLYIPEPHNDFIFSILAEETGFVGSVLVIILFAIFVWRGIAISMKAEDSFGTLLAIGLTTMIGLQAIINIAVVTNTMPVTGMPLPFFSYGGTAMLANLIAVGLLLSISRNSKKAS